MENGEKLVPEIRFKGFTNAWVQRKFCDVFDYSIPNNTLSRSELNYENGEVKNIHYGDILVKHDYCLDVEQSNIPFITNGYADNYKDRLLQDGDIVFADTAEDETTGKVIEIINAQNSNIVAGLHTMAYRPRIKISPCFSGYYFNSQSYRKQLLPLMQGIKVLSLSKSSLSKTETITPVSPDEEAAIGNFFRSLDNTITQHKRKLDGLKELKKAYLQQMFPQAGERVPCVRFAGFSGGWQERKLGNISVKVTEKNKGNQFNETFTNSAEHGIISQRDFFDKDISNTKNLDGYFIVRPDDFVYNPRISNFAPVGPIKRNRLERIGVMSPLYYVFRVTEGDCTFIEKYFESIYWYDFMKMNGDKGVRSDRLNIKDSVFEELPVPFPSVAEQKNIGNLFRNLDEQITAQTTKLGQLRQLKAAYLQKMFI